MPEGSVLTVEFEIFGQPFAALNGGQESQCGWCKDRWGVNWQIIPDELGRALRGLDGYDSSYALRVMMKISKIIVTNLKPASN